MTNIGALMYGPSSMLDTPPPVYIILLRVETAKDHLELHVICHSLNCGSENNVDGV